MTDDCQDKLFAQQNMLVSKKNEPSEEKKNYFSLLTRIADASQQSLNNVMKNS